MRKIDYAWVIVGAAALTGMTTHGFGRFSYSMIIPSMMKGLALTKYQAGLIQSFHFWGYLTFSFLGGFLVARYSARIIIALAVLLIGVSIIATGFSNSFFTALIMRTLTGIGTGAAYVPAMSLLSFWFQNERRGLAAGLVSIGPCLGLITISQLVPVIIIAYGEEGWRYSWHYLGAVPVFIAVICGLFLRNRPEDLQKKGLKERAKIDSTPEHAEMSAPHNEEADNFSMSANKGISGNFRNPGTEKPRAKNNKPSSLKWAEVFSNRNFWHLGAIYAAFGFSYIILMTFYPIYLSFQRQMPSTYYGNLFMVMAITSLAGGTFWGKVSDWIGRRSALMIVFSMMSVSYLVVIFMQNPFGDYLGMIIYAFGAWAIPTIMIAAIGDYAGPALASSALGFITLIFGIGQALGPWVAGWLADATGSFIPSFYLASGVGMIGIVILLFLRKPGLKLSEQV